jgi:hypothetical protein
MILPRFLYSIEILNRIRFLLTLRLPVSGYILMDRVPHLNRKFPVRRIPGGDRKGTGTFFSLDNRMSTGGDPVINTGYVQESE